MKLNKLNSEGFAVLELVVVVVVIGAIMAIGTFMLTQSHAQSPNTINATNVKASSVGTGTLDLATTNPVVGGTVSLTATSSNLPNKVIPEMSLSCTQNNQDTYLSVVTEPSQATPWVPQFNLSSPLMSTSTSADCTANFYYYTWTGKRETGIVPLAQTSFTAQP